MIRLFNGPFAVLAVAAAVLAPCTANAVPAAGPTPPGPAATPATDLPITLGQARDWAASANIDIIHARQARAAAIGMRIMAAARPNPVLSVGATQVRSRLVGPDQFGRTPDEVVRIDQPIELGGKRGARIAAANAGLAAADQDVADTARQVRAQVETAYAALRAAQDRVTATTDIAAGWARSASVAQRRLAAGDISAGELARQQVEAARASADALAAVAARTEARTLLAILIGRDGDAARLVAADPWPAAPSPSALPAEELAAARPDVRAAVARLEQARQLLRGARALRTPDVSVGVQYEYQPLPIGVGPSVGFGLSVPLQVGTRYSGEIAVAGAALGDAEASAQKALSVATAEIAAARSGLATASEKRRRFEEELVPAARQAAQTAEFAYARGALALTDLLDARRALAAASLGLVDARADEAAAGSRLIAAEATKDDQ